MDAPAARVATQATDERSCADRGRDAVEQVVGCVQQRLSHYRATGQFAVAFGWPVLQRRIAAQINAALGRTGGSASEPRTAAEAAGTPWPEREPAAADSDAAADEAPTAAPAPARTEVEARPLAVVEPSTPHDGNGHGANGHGANGHDAPAASALAIPGYDSLSASQVVERLAGLPSSDLDEVRDYESAHRNRRTILGKIDQIQAAH
ncbi:MAG TPA: hypothetical protein VGO03_11585 [Acidimicrobiia bacterium]